MNNSKKFTLKNLLCLLVGYCLIRFSLVMAQDFFGFRLPIVLFVGMGIMFLCALMDKRYAGQLLQINMALLGANILFVVLIKELTNQATYVSIAANYINQLIVLFVLWGFYQFIRMRDTNSKKRLVALYTSMVAISAGYTLYVAIKGHDSIIRNTAFGEFDASFPFKYGGFDFIYGLVLVYAILFTVLAKGKGRMNRKTRVYIVLLLLLIAATVIVSGFSSAFVLIVIFSILVATKTWQARILWLCLTAICVFVIPEVLVRLIEAIPFMPEITSRRVGEVLLSFSGRGTSSYFTEDGQRLDRILWSVQAFWAHPLFGLFGENGIEQLGYHTEWIEQLARYGLFTAIFNASFWVGTYRRMKRAARNMPITQQCVKNAFLLYLILGFLNPISMVITAAPLFVLCPFAESLFLSDNATTRLE